MKSDTSWILNTSNPGKLQEFERLFDQYGAPLQSTQKDLAEIKADPVLVVVHKAAQLEEGVLVEDTSLEIEGADIGISVRWLLDNLPDYIGQRAIFRCLLAHSKGDLIYVYEGKIYGRIVSPQGKNGFGFDPFFLPDGSESTLATSKPDEQNARAKAVAAFFQGDPIAKMPPITEWQSV